MKVIIAGGTGFLGRALTASLLADGQDVVVLTRVDVARSSDAAGSGEVARRLQPSAVVVWTPNGETGPWAGEIDGADAVVNLAGESIGDRRWTSARKRRILESRLEATASLAKAIRGARRPPAVFVSASAVGYYGPLDDRKAPETTPAGSDFLARVCAEWEDRARRAGSDRTRVVLIRSGLVLERDGGALPRMLPPFWFGAGGKVGSGRQYWPWIHRGDWVSLVRWTLATPAVSGPVNAVGPNPVTNEEFARTLGRVLHRPAFMPAPAFALRLLLGEMADGLLLSGQRAVPAVAERLGFRFKYERLEDALRAIFGSLG